MRPFLAQCPRHDDAAHGDDAASLPKAGDRKVRGDSTFDGAGGGRRDRRRSRRQQRRGRLKVDESDGELARCRLVGAQGAFDDGLGPSGARAIATSAGVADRSRRSRARQQRTTAANSWETGVGASKAGTSASIILEQISRRVLPGNGNRPVRNS